MTLQRAPLIFLVSMVLAGCGTTSYLIDPSYMYDYPIEPLEAPNPALDGPYTYHVYFYGSGDDIGISISTDEFSSPPDLK